MEMLKIGVDLGAVFQMNEVCEGTYVKGVLFSFLQQLMKFNHQIVEIFIFSADNPSISPMVFESLSVHQLNIDQVIFTGGESLISYLQALEVEVYFSADEFMVAKAQAVGIYHKDVLHHKGSHTGQPQSPRGIQGGDGRPQRHRRRLPGPEAVDRSLAQL